MIIATSAIITIGAPIILVASACISKFYSYITGIQPVDVSRESFLIEMSKYTRGNTSKGVKSNWVCGGNIHALCRYATVFSNYPPIVIIHGTGSCSFNYVEFMESLPKTYDVYCIDLPGWGISKDPLIDLANVELDQVYKYYAQTVIAVLAEIHPLKNATFTLVGHSLGSFLLLKSITSIPLNRVNKLVLTCLPGIIPQSRYPYFFATYFVYGFESIFKQWWSRHLFCAFLYRKRTQLETLKRMHAFIPNGAGYKIVGRHTPFRGILPPVWISPIKVELLDASNYVQIDLINGSKDALVDIRPVRAFVKTTINPKTIKLHELEGVGHMVFSQKELFQRLISIIDDEKLLSAINIK